MNKINKIITLIFITVLISSCNIFTSTEKSTDELFQVCDTLKKSLETELDIKLPIKLNWIERVGDGPRSGKMANLFLEEFSEGDDYFCFLKLTDNKSKKAETLDIAFRKLDLSLTQDQCAGLNICYIREDISYRMLFAKINREGREKDRKWKAPILTSN